MWPVSTATAPLGIPRERAVAQRAMLGRRGAAPEGKAHHQVAQVSIEGVGVRRHQLERATGGDQGLVELAVVALPGSVSRAPSSIRRSTLSPGARRRRGPPIPCRRRRRSGGAHAAPASASARPALRGSGRSAAEPEAALSFGQHEALGRQAAQNLTQGADPTPYSARMRRAAASLPARCAEDQVAAQRR